MNDRKFNLSTPLIKPNLVHNFLRLLEKKNLEKLPFFFATHKITYIAGYLLSTTTNSARNMSIFGHCHSRAIYTGENKTRTARISLN